VEAYAVIGLAGLETVPLGLLDANTSAVGVTNSSQAFTMRVSSERPQRRCAIHAGQRSAQTHFGQLNQMPDYFPLIARAISKLKNNTGEARREVYDRARAALLSQLRAADPPYTRLEVARERVALEEAIRKREFDQLQYLAGTARRSLNARWTAKVAARIRRRKSE